MFTAGMIQPAPFCQQLRKLWIYNFKNSVHLLRADLDPRTEVSPGVDRKKGIWIMLQWLHERPDQTDIIFWTSTVF